MTESAVLRDDLVEELVRAGWTRPVVLEDVRLDELRGSDPFRLMVLISAAERIAGRPLPEDLLSILETGDDLLHFVGVARGQGPDAGG